MFGPYRDVRKLTMFGSARTRPADPIYVLARDLATHLADAGWMVVTGAGPGIMAAGIEGAGRDIVLRRQHPAPLRAGCQPVHRPGPQARRDAVLLHPQAHADQGVARLRRPPGRLRHPRRVLRAADPAPDRQGRAGAGRARRDPRRRVLGRLARFVEELVDGAGLHLARRPRPLPHRRRRSRTRPTRSSTSTATTTRAAGWATCWCCAAGARRASASWPSSTGEFADIVTSGSIRLAVAVPARALRQRPPRAAAGRPALRPRSTTAGCAAHRRAEPRRRLSEPGSVPSAAPATPNGRDRG